MRRVLISVYVVGLLLLVCASLLETNTRLAIAAVLLGGFAIVTAGLIDGISRQRQARRQPYTTTDWLKGGRPPGSRPQSRLRGWLYLGAMICWTAMFVFLGDPAHAGVGHFANGLVVAIYAVLIGVDLFRRAPTEARPSGAG